MVSAHIVITTYIVVTITTGFLAYLYWYASKKACWNEILLSMFIMVTSVFFDSLFFTFGFFYPYVFRSYELILIPKFFLILGVINMVRSGFRER